MGRVYEENRRLSRYEYRQQRIYLQSLPRFLGLVLGNACNIYCPHCYQSKNGDNLLKPAEIGRELRREFLALYPFLGTLRIQGGEALAYTGFRELLEDAASAADQPLVSISTNGTLIDEDWAERIVRLPFKSVTVSIDGGSPATYARMRRGADLNEVLSNVRRIQRWKEKLRSELPSLDSFFVIMRSNFREIPQYIELAHEYGFTEIALQTMEVNNQNASREPALARDEVIAEETEVRELHELMRGVLPQARRHFRMVRTSGLTSLFQSRGLDTSFLGEAAEALYPESDDLLEDEPAGVPLCPNPWTTLFVAENGDVHLCFLSEPVGNLYEMPLAAIWNCQRALIKRSHMMSGRYLASGCSARWCSWREGAKAEPATSAEIQGLRAEMEQLARRASLSQSLVQIGETTSAISGVRRVLTTRDRRIHELEAMFVQLCDDNAELHRQGQQYIDALERDIADMQARDRRDTEQRRGLERDYDRLRRMPIVRIADRVSRIFANRFGSQRTTE